MIIVYGLESGNKSVESEICCDVDVTIAENDLVFYRETFSGYDNVVIQRNYSSMSLYKHFALGVKSFSWRHAQRNGIRFSKHVQSSWSAATYII